MAQEKPPQVLGGNKIHQSHDVSRKHPPPPRQRRHDRQIKQLKESVKSPVYPKNSWEQVRDCGTEEIPTCGLLASTFEYSKQTQRKPTEEGLPRPVLDDTVEATNMHVLKESLSPVQTLVAIVW